MLESWSGMSVLSPSPLVVAHVWTDACPRSYSTHLGLAADTTAVFSHEVLRRHRKKNIWFLEALAILEALRLFAPLWSSPLTVVVHVDNENVEHGLHSGSSHDPLTQKLLWEIFGFCFTHNFTLHPMHPVVLLPGTRRPAGQPPPTFASSMGITSAVATLLWNGLAPSTRDCAGGTVTAFQTFCTWHLGANIACLPATGVQLLKWLGSMSSTGRSYHSTKHKLSHLRSHHVNLGLSLAGFECSHLEQALRGYKCIHGARHTGAKLPITLPLLRRLVTAVDTFGDLSVRDRTMFKVVFTLSFACFLHSGEVVWDWHTDPAIVLHIGSVELAADHAIVTLPASKMDPFHLGVKVVTPLTPSHTRRSLPSFSTPLPSPAWHSRPMLAIPFDAVPPRGRPALAPAPRPSSASAVGILTVSGATLTAPPANAMTSPSLPSSVFVTAPSSPTAPRGKTWGPPSPSLGPALSRVLSAAQVPRLSVGRPGASEPARFAADPQSNPFSHLSAV
ncbi:hypothetical protein NDA14_006457 [Ustilago hordei]|nr:hypothetical protein NDA14_006457 [Ustilago hordei]